MSATKQYPPLREIRVTWESGNVTDYNMAAHLTDAEMLAYYSPGTSFNVGNGPLDHFDTVVASQVIK